MLLYNRLQGFLIINISKESINIIVFQQRQSPRKGSIRGCYFWFYLARCPQPHPILLRLVGAGSPAQPHPEVFLDHLRSGVGLKQFNKRKESVIYFMHKSTSYITEKVLANQITRFFDHQSLQKEQIDVFKFFCT